MYLAEDSVESLVEPAIRAQVPGSSAVKSVMKHVRVISVGDPSVLLLHGIVKCGRQHVVVDANDAETALQQLQIVTIALVWKPFCSLVNSGGNQPRRYCDFRSIRVLHEITETRR